jgi:hypothetical protein
MQRGVRLWHADGASAPARDRVTLGRSSWEDDRNMRQMTRRKRLKRSVMMLVWRIFNPPNRLLAGSWVKNLE